MRPSGVVLLYAGCGQSLNSEPSMHFFKTVVVTSVAVAICGCGESSEELRSRAITGDMSALKELADRGDAEDQGDIGFMYYEGFGVPQDYAEALKWFRLSAEQGYVYAQSSLARIYRSGRGVPKDHVESYAWYSVAVSGGDADAANNRDIVAGELTPDQLSEGQKRAGELFKKIGSGK
jgi:hypothetical protein